MSVNISLQKIKATGKFWNERTWKCQVYDTEEIEWFEDYSNPKKLVIDNRWVGLEDDFYGKSKPADYDKFSQYIKDNLFGEKQEMYLKAVELIKNSDDIYFEISW